MSRDELLIALLKLKQSHAEFYKSRSNNAELEETKKIFNERRNKIKKSRIKKIRKDLYEKEKGLESENEKQKKQHAEELKKIENVLEGLQEEIKKNYYKPIRNKGAFNDDYVEYESRGDRYKSLLPENYLDLIRPFLRDIINNYKTHGE